MAHDFQLSHQKEPGVLRANGSVAFGMGSASAKGFTGVSSNSEL